MYKFGTIILTISLCSCHVGNNMQIDPFVSDLEIKETLNLSDNHEQIHPTWYEIFNDPDLNTLLKATTFSNISIKEGLERLRQSRYAYEINNKESLPMLNGSAEYDYNKSNNKSYAYNDLNIFKLGFDVAWEIDIWGKNKYISDQYYLLMKQAEYSLQDIKVTISSEVIKNYIELRKNQEKLRIANKNLSLQNDILKSVKDKNNTGLTNDLALNHAMYSIEKTKSTIPPLKQEIEKSKNAMAILLGCLPQNLPIDLDKQTKNITAKTFKYSVKKLQNLPLDIIRTRPDIRTSEQSIHIQNAILNQAIASIYPSFSIEGTFGFISSSLPHMIEKKNQTYGYTPGITVPIWQWGKLKNNIKLQKHTKEEYILNYNEAIITAIMELKNAINFVERSYEVNKHFSSALNKMRNIFNLTKNKYENGLIEFTELAQAEQDVLKAQNDYIDSNTAILQNITAFYKATGGGYNFN
jgi:NodT family efflux transporter outer membrane factor (OMF) lipoprotein